MAQFGMPGEYDYDGDCGVSMSPTTTVDGSQHPDAIGPGAVEVPFAGGGESNILSGGGGHGGFALGKVPD